MTSTTQETKKSPEVALLTWLKSKLNFFAPKDVIEIEKDYFYFQEVTKFERQKDFKGEGVFCIVSRPLVSFDKSEFKKLGLIEKTVYQYSRGDLLTYIIFVPNENKTGFISAQYVAENRNKA